MPFAVRKRTFPGSRIELSSLQDAFPRRRNAFSPRNPPFHFGGSRFRAAKPPFRLAGTRFKATKVVSARAESPFPEPRAAFQPTERRIGVRQRQAPEPQNPPPHSGPAPSTEKALTDPDDADASYPTRIFAEAGREEVRKMRKGVEASASASPADVPSRPGHGCRAGILRPDDDSARP